MTVLVWGVPTESPVQMITSALESMGARTIHVTPQGTGVDLDLGVASDGSIEGWLSVDGSRVRWEDITGVYARPVEPELAPQFRSGSADTRALARARRVHDALLGFTELTGCRVANKLSAMSSNMSKPLQAQIISRHGFSIPDTLITDNADEVDDFASRHREIVYKSTSGVRSIVSTYRRDPDRMRRLRWCPVQFQERIAGPDVRVHVVGRRVFAAIVDSDAVDYRYARRQVGRDATLRAFDLPEPWSSRCVALAADLELPFAGIDLKLGADGRVVCFEANPSPGFPWYETEAGLPISDAVASYLIGR